MRRLRLPALQGRFKNPKYESCLPHEKLTDEVYFTPEKDEKTKKAPSRTPQRLYSCSALTTLEHGIHKKIEDLRKEIIARIRNLFQTRERWEGRDRYLEPDPGSSSISLSFL